MIFEENIGPRLSIDEVALSKGELYTIVTNKDGKGKKNTIVACIEGTKAGNITNVLNKIPVKLRAEVTEITLDMARNMEAACKESFPMATLVTDRFHVVRLAQQAMQNIRIKLGWKELDIENKKIKEARSKKTTYKPKLLSNGDTPKQLLTRCRYVLAKKETTWTTSQKERAQITFEKYPELEKAYKHTMDLRNCYENRFKIDAMIAFKNWIDKTKKSEYQDFNTVANTIVNNYNNILNYFNNRSTNASAESFNSKIKLFRANQRGVVDTKFFLFRLMKLFA